jgi:hypothetical protein
MVKIDNLIAVLSGNICLQCRFYSGTLRKEGLCSYSGWREDLNKVFATGSCRNYEQKT